MKFENIDINIIRRLINNDDICNKVMQYLKT